MPLQPNANQSANQTPSAGERTVGPFVQFTIANHRLEFWLETDDQKAVVWVRRAGDAREKYPVFGLGAQGVCWRYPGLPTGWGFKLTRDRKIKEVR